MQDIGDVREHMDVVGSDGELIGKIDRVEGQRLKLTKDGPNANGRHHFIPADWVAEVDGEVRLSRTADAACRDWQEEEPMFAGGDGRIGGAGP